MLEANGAAMAAAIRERVASFRIRKAHPLAAVSVKERLACGAVLLFAAFLDLFRLSEVGYGNTYYAAAVKSMLQSWHNFFFASFDPGGFVTIDKPPVAFWLQTISAKLFGFNGVSLALPQALAGVASVAVLYVLVRRIFGMVPALLAALALAISPVNVASNRDNIVDSLLVLVVLLAAWAAIKAVETGQFRWLIICAALVGLGFNVKMLEAYLVVPAFVVHYALAAPHPWRKRVGHLALAGLVSLVISLSWATAVDLTPVSQRPYVGSSGTNSELNLAIGYNGIQRLVGGLFGHGGRGAGSTRGSAARDATSRRNTSTSETGNAGGVSGGSGIFGGGSRAGDARRTGNFAGGPGGFGTGGPSPLRLFGTALGSQVSWLLPLALLALLASIWEIRPRALLARWQERSSLAAAPRASGEEPGAGGAAAVRTRAPEYRASVRSTLALVGREWSALRLTSRQQAWVLWGMWLLTMGTFFSVASFFHPYYMVNMAPSIAALAGIGIVGLWHDYRQPGWRGWLLPCALVLTAIAQVGFLAGAPASLDWLAPLVVIVALVAAALLALVRQSHRTQNVLPADGQPIVVATDGPAVERIKTVWATLAPRLRWSSMRTRTLAGVGVAALLLAPAVWSIATIASPGNEMAPSAGPQATGGFARAAGDMQEQTNTSLTAYLLAHQGHTKYLFATLNAMSAAPYVIATGKPVMALGGFSGGDQILTTAQLQQMVKANQVRYFLVSSGRGFAITPQIIAELPPQIREILEEMGGTRGGFGGIGGFGGFGANGANGALTSWVTNNCTVVPASQWSRSSGSTGSSASGGSVFPGGGGARETAGLQLYDCAGK
jgi:4-amino-4-deoxy-L-arabinose transferase-like glycosyltransferase